MLHLTLILPDGSRSFIPAAWTNLNEICPKKFTPQNRQPQTDLIATTSTFFHVHKIVNALFGKILSSKQKSKNASRKENNHEKTAKPLAHTGKTDPHPGHLEHSRSPTTKTGHNRSRQSDQENNLPGKNKANQGDK